MNAIALLLKEHESHRRLLNKIEEDHNVFASFREEVIHHVNMEEDVLYPNLLKVKNLEAIVLEAWEEHSLLMQLFQETDALPAGGKEWLAKVAVLKKLMLLHLENEEENLFPKITKLASPDFLEQVGREMLSHKKQMDPEEILYPKKD